MWELRRSFPWWIPLACLIIGLLESPCLAQSSKTPPDIPRFTGDLGVGISAGSGSGYLSVSGNFAYRQRNHLYLIRSVYNFEPGDWMGLGVDWPRASVWDIGLLYGLSSNKSRSIASISAGLAFVSGVRRGRFLGGGGLFTNRYYEKLTFQSVGLPIEGKLLWTPAYGFGLGFAMVADLNFEESFVGGQFCLRFGG